MTYQGVIGGFCAAALVGLHTGTNVRRPWTHVPWVLMWRRPESFGGSAAVRRHFGYIVAWSLLLALYAEVANAITAFGLVPGVARIYPAIGESIPPRIGPASEVMGAFIAALTVQAIVKKIVERKHQNVSAKAVDLAPALTPLRRSVAAASVAGAHRIATFALHVIEPFYEHLWQRDGAILKGSANALLDEFGDWVCSKWLSDTVSGLKPNGGDEVPTGLLKALMEPRNGGYISLQGALSQLDNRLHKRVRCDDTVNVRLELDEATVEATLFDYSHGGAAIVLSSEITPRSSIRLFFDQFNFDMEVVHCRTFRLDGHHEKFVIGMRCKSPFAGRSLCDMLKRGPD